MEKITPENLTPSPEQDGLNAKQEEDKKIFNAGLQIYELRKTGKLPIDKVQLDEFKSDDPEVMKIIDDIRKNLEYDDSWLSDAWDKSVELEQFEKTIKKVEYISEVIAYLVELQLSEKGQYKDLKESLKRQDFDKIISELRVLISKYGQVQGYTLPDTDIDEIVKFIGDDNHQKNQFFSRIEGKRDAAKRQIENELGRS